MTSKQINNSLSAPDGSHYVTLTDGAGNLSNAGSSGYATPTASGATVLQNNSGNVAAATATATLTNTVGKTTYISGFLITGGGATAGSVINATITGLLGGTMAFAIPVPTGAVLGINPLFLNFQPALPATGTNVAIQVIAPSFGTGNTNATVSAWGYQV